MDGVESIFTIFIAAITTYLGYRYGLKQARVTRGEEINEAQERCRVSLLSQIQENHDRLNEGFTRDAYQRIVFRSLLKTDALESAISSENYQLFTTRIQSVLSDYYEGVKRLNELTRRLDGEEISTEISKISNAQRPVHAGLIKASEDLEKLLEKDN